jgi:hypothetical protein
MRQATVRDDEATIGDLLTAIAAVVKKTARKFRRQGMSGRRKKGRAPSVCVCGKEGSIHVREVGKSGHHQRQPLHNIPWG